jgi:hypothetical protein
MKPIEWTAAEQTLKEGNKIRLRCDGHELELSWRIYKMRLILAYSVNGKIEDNEEMRLFGRPVKQSVWTAKSLSLMARMSKAELKRRNVDPKETRTVYYPYWTSFKALKAHLLKNNKNVELIADCEQP